MLLVYIYIIVNTVGFPYFIFIIRLHYLVEEKGERGGGGGGGPAVLSVRQTGDPLGAGWHTVHCNVEIQFNFLGILLELLLLFYFLQRIMSCSFS